MSTGASRGLIQEARPDQYFTLDQINRMRELLDRANAGSLASKEKTELEALVDQELSASARRTQALADAAGR